MSHPLKIATRYALFVTLAALVSAPISAPGSTRSPYVTALSIAAPGSAFAAGHCNDRACGTSFKCERAPGFNCVGRCQTHQCF